MLAAFCRCVDGIAQHRHAKDERILPPRGESLAGGSGSAPVAKLDPIAGQRFWDVLLAAGVDVLLNEPVTPLPRLSATWPITSLSTGTVIQPDVSLSPQPNGDDLGLESRTSARHMDTWRFDHP
jgi:hypothetical protein